MIVINDDCIGCHRCIRECPLSAISSDNSKVTISEECTNCQACSKVCPVDALSLEGKPPEGAVQCFSCPIQCLIKPDKEGACRRFINVNGELLRKVHLHTFNEVKNLVGIYHEKCIREPIILAYGAGTTYPDFKPAPFAVKSKVDDIDVVTVVSEAPLSYSGMLVKIDSDEYIGEEGAPVFLDKRDDAEPAPCQAACPAGIDVPRYIRHINAGKFGEALNVIREKVPFPGVLGRICFHPCETKCLRNSLGGPIAIKALKRIASDMDSGSWKQYAIKLPPTGKRIAVIGSGPCGMTAAYYLAKLGHQITVFEKHNFAGGMMRLAIPDYRLPAQTLNVDMELIIESGIEMIMRKPINSLDTLLQNGYDAIFIASGATQGVKLGITGEDNPKVIQCLDFLRDVKLGKVKKKQGKIAVIGGGNAAIDTARTALRIGAKEVTIVYRRTKTEMPAADEEIEAGLEEGVQFEFLSAPIKITKKRNKLHMLCIKMTLGEPDDSGRRRPQPVQGSEYTLIVDNIIVAIGQKVDLLNQFDIETADKGTIKVNPATLATSKDKVFAGGDCVNGPSSVIEAIAAGRQAAVSIDRFLGGTGNIDEILTQTERIPRPISAIKPKIEERVPTLLLTNRQRIKNTNEVDLGFSEGDAIREANRCLKCDLEGQIMVGHVTTAQYGSKVISIGGPTLLTAKGGNPIARLLVDIANKKEVALKVDGGARLKIQIGRSPDIDGKVVEKMRIGCGSACAGLFAPRFKEAADEVIIIDHHITSLFTQHQCGVELGARYSGLTLRGIKSTPGRYFAVAKPGHGYGGTVIEDPLEVIANIDKDTAWASMTLLITESTGKRAAMYRWDGFGKFEQIDLTEKARDLVNTIANNCEESRVSAVFVGGSGGSARVGVTKLPIRLTRAIHNNKVRMSVAGAPVYILPGGGINFLVDVEKVITNAFTWVPTPAVVCPIEYTMRLDEYIDLGGYVSSIKTLDEIKQYIESQDYILK
jgi:NADPH-dependent glutamate synthase beta subunit-like oxidoreductase/NAD-dependent dihydropyrimidine dehydrogenase PreA subunit